jgi:5-methylcytosine-specific restriction endonuclease McrA
MTICANPECLRDFAPSNFHPLQKCCSKKCSTRAWTLKNQDKHSAANRKYDVIHSDRVSSRRKAQYQAVKYNVLSRMKTWYLANTEKAIAKANRRRAMKAGAFGEHYTRKQFKDLCDQTGDVCLCCKQAKKLEADHVVPLSKGGSDAINNIQPLCQYCNDSKGTKTVDYRGKS